MGSNRKTAARSLHRDAHYRLLFAAFVGIGAALLAGDIGLATRSLIGWDVFVIVLLAGMARMMATTTLAELRRRAAQKDETAPVILGLMVIAVVASLGGILAEMSNARSGGARNMDIVLALATLVLSWLCMHVLFATHYAHRFYGDRDTANKNGFGLIFPEPDAAPNYMEFIYFAFCVGMTYQVADIMTASRTFRSLITLHGVLSFFYNTFVLALAVNLFSQFSSGR